MLRGQFFLCPASFTFCNFKDERLYFLEECLGAILSKITTCSSCLCTSIIKHPRESCSVGREDNTTAVLEIGLGTIKEDIENLCWRGSKLLFTIQQIQPLLFINRRRDKKIPRNFRLYTFKREFLGDI